MPSSTSTLIDQVTGTITGNDVVRYSACGWGGVKEGRSATGRLGGDIEADRMTVPGKTVNMDIG